MTFPPLRITSSASSSSPSFSSSSSSSSCACRCPFICQLAPGPKFSPGSSATIGLVLDWFSHSGARLRPRPRVASHHWEVPGRGHNKLMNNYNGREIVQPGRQIWRDKC
ncbi:unnamed protein product [Gadus morhua 'NCC']